MKDAMMKAQDMIDDGASDREIMKATKLSAKEVKKIRLSYSDRPGEYDEGTKQVLAHGGKGQYKAVKDGDVTNIIHKGKVVGTADFDRGADGYFVSIKGKKGQEFFDDAQKMVDYFAKNKITEEKEYDNYRKEYFEIGTDKYRGHCEKVTPGEGLDEANYEIKNGKIHISKANFRKVHKDYKNSTKGKERMMALDPKSGATTSYEVVFEAVDPADVDDDATDADRAAASKNIIHQLRKSIDQDGKFAVTFGDNKKVKVDAKIAKAINDKFMSIKRPPDKVKFQAQAAKSYKDMLKVLKNGFNEEIQKETILDRIDKKLKERKELHEASNK